MKFDNPEQIGAEIVEELMSCQIEIPSHSHVIRTTLLNMIEGDEE